MSLLLYLLFTNAGLIFSLAAFAIVFYYIYTSPIALWKKYFFLISYCVIYGGIPPLLKAMGLYHAMHFL